MVRKNKLYKHHKSKAYFVIRNFSFSFLAIIGLGAIVTVPTYIASITNQNVPLKADYDKNKLEDGNVDIEEESNSPDLLEY